MKQTIDKLREQITAHLTAKLRASDCVEWHQLMEILLRAYNAHQEDVYDGVDYIFNLYDQEDLKCCVNGGMTAYEIYELHNRIKEYRETPAFLFGENHRTAQQFKTWNEIQDYVVGSIGDIVQCMLHQPEQYRELYDYCIGDYFKEEVELMHKM